ncbi:MAG: protein-L-isoaspartate O-methyltransferase, partial [Rhodoferax sp.]
MKQRPSFPARMDTTPAKSKPTAHAIPAAPQGHGMESSAVRARMVQKLATGGITDPHVLAAMGAIERHRFVDSALINQ